MQMQMQRRLTAGANRGTLGGASGRQTECSAALCGQERERRTVLGLFALFLAPRVCGAADRQGEHGTVCELGERRGGKGERGLLAGWIK